MRVASCCSAPRRVCRVCRVCVHTASVSTRADRRPGCWLAQARHTQAVRNLARHGAHAIGAITEIILLGTPPMARTRKSRAVRAADTPRGTSRTARRASATRRRPSTKSQGRATTRSGSTAGGGVTRSGGTADEVCVRAAFGSPLARPRRAGVGRRAPAVPAGASEHLAREAAKYRSVDRFALVEVEADEVKRHQQRRRSQYSHNQHPHNQYSHNQYQHNQYSRNQHQHNQDSHIQHPCNQDSHSQGGGAAKWGNERGCRIQQTPPPPHRPPQSDAAPSTDDDSLGRSMDALWASDPSSCNSETAPARDARR